MSGKIQYIMTIKKRKSCAEGESQFFLPGVEGFEFGGGTVIEWGRFIKGGYPFRVFLGGIISTQGSGYLCRK